MRQKRTPTPAVNLTVDIDFLAHGLNETGSLFVDKEVQRVRTWRLSQAGRRDADREPGQ